MEWITEWVRNIVVLVLIGSFLDMMLPTSNFGKYVRFVIGLVMIVAFLSPFLAFLRIGPDQLAMKMKETEETMTSSENKNYEIQKSEIESRQAAYIVEQIEKQLLNDAKEASKNAPYNVLEVTVVLQEGVEPSFQWNEAMIKQVELTLVERGQTVQPVGPIDVETETMSTGDSAPFARSAVMQFAKRWQLNESKILTRIEGGM
ncbi:MAG: stage III sporulation protein AF [Bacilli bacterium]